MPRIGSRAPPPLPSVSPRAKSPADAFSKAASGEPWFVSAHMERQLGGLRRGPGGSVARRPSILEVVVRQGHAKDAQALLTKLGLDDARIVERREHSHHRHGWRR